MCICGRIGQLAERFNEKETKPLVSELNRHLATIESIVNKSKSLARYVLYDIRPKFKRSKKILSITTANTTPQKQIFERFRSNPEAFWQCDDDDSCMQLGRRLACITIYLLSRLDSKSELPASIARFVPEPASHTEYRYAGKRYLEIARQVGGLGTVLCLPLEIPYSTLVSFS